MALPFKPPDHSPFSSKRVRLAYALRDGLYVHINEVGSGRMEGGVCPVCKTPVVARKSTKIASHFAHYNGARPCKLSVETRAHIWAKEVIEQEKRILLPAIRVELEGEALETHEAKEWTFDAVRLEQRVGDVVPDVILSLGKREIFLEVRVTHAVDELKKAKLERSLQTTVEVDLRAYRKSTDDAAIAEGLITTAPRHWIYNPKIESALQRLRAKQEAARARHVEAVRRQAVELTSFQVDLDGAFPEELLEARELALSYGLKSFLIPSIETGNAFGVPPTLWQAALLVRGFLREATGATLAPVSAIRAVNLIEDCLSGPFRRKIKREVIDEAKAIDPECRFPFEITRDYLEQLNDRGFLDDHGVGYGLSAEVSRGLRELHREKVDREKRVSSGKARLKKILEQVPEPERQDFHLSQWLTAPIPGIGRDFTSLAEGGGSDWHAFEDKLLVIERMERGGPVAEALLGLPLVEVAARAKVQLAQREVEASRRRREAEERASADRKTRVQSYAASKLGKREAEARLAMHIKGSQESFLVYASQSDGQLAKVISAIDTLAERLEREAKQAAEIAGFRQSLEREAIRELGEERGRLFLQAHHPAIAARPGEYCTSAHTLQECISLLGKPKKRH